MSEKSSTKANFRGKIKKICPTTVDELNISQISRFNKKAKKVLSKERDEGSIHLGAEIGIISCRKFWQGAKTLAQNFGKEKHAKAFGMEFMPKFCAEILSQNTNTVPKLLVQNFGIEITCQNFWLKNHAKISCRNNRLEMAFRRTDV